MHSRPRPAEMQAGVSRNYIWNGKQLCHEAYNKSFHSRCSFVINYKSYYLNASLLHKPLSLPLARTPAAHEDNAADVLIEGKANPHADKTIAKGNADDVA